MPRYIPLLLLFSLLGAVLAGCAGQQTPPPPTPEAGSTASAPTVAGDVSLLQATGLVAPAKQVQLSFPIGGRVARMSVGIGDTVEAGQVLAALDGEAIDRGVARAKTDLEFAQAQLSQAEAGDGLPEDKVALAKAKLDHLAALDALLQAETYHDLDDLDHKQRSEADAQLELARAEVDAAVAREQKALDRLQGREKGAASDEVIMARANVAKAQLALAQALADQAGSQLAASFRGTVMKVSAQEGEAVSPGQPVILLADTQRWRVETKDVGELVIGKVHVGQKVRVLVNAFLKEDLSGSIVAVSPSPVVQLGDTTYAVIVELEPTDLSLKTGMTAKVQFTGE